MGAGEAASANAAGFDPADLPPVAVTMGEPAGIGGDILLKAWTHRLERRLPSFFVLDDPARLTRLAGRLGLAVPVCEIAAPAEARECHRDALPVLPLPLEAPVEPRRPNAAGARAAIESIRRAVALTARGEACAVVTNPIHKGVLLEVGFAHPGHTEFLGELAGEHWPEAGAARPVMMLAGGTLRVVPVTVHMALKQVPDRLTEDLIVETGRIAAAALAADFGVDAPRLAVAGLNPHAGEGGHLGTEDETVVAPAVRRLAASGIAARGPLPADTMFHEAARATYDGALCMYHDQALAPLKALYFDEAVNVTLGLPFVRTSPDHGTAFDLAGTGRARETSFVEAMRLASVMAANRAATRATGPSDAGSPASRSGARA